MAVNFDELTELTADSVFTLEQGFTRPFEMHREAVFALAIDVNPHLPVVSRSNYTVLDVMSDVGGLAEVLFLFVSLGVSLLNYKNLNSFLTAKLYKMKAHSDPETLANLTPTKCCNIRDFIFDCLPLRCQRKWRLPRKQILMREGHRRVNKERDIVNVFRSLRYLKAVVKKFLVKDRALRKELKRACEYKILDASMEVPDTIEIICLPQNSVMSEASVLGGTLSTSIIGQQ